MLCATLIGPQPPLALIAAMPATNSISPTGRISTGPLARYIERHSSKTVATMLWPVLRSASSSGSKIGPAAAVPQMMMRIDDRQLRFEDRLLFLFREPRLVWLPAMTKPAGLNGLRHGDLPLLPTLPGFPSP